MKKLFLLFLLAINGSISAQPSKTDPYFKETWDTVSVRGPSSIVRHVLQDKKGNIWLATWQGIMMYDGKVFTNYTKKDNLIHFHVFSIMEAKNGDLWFGTVRGGAYRYDGKTWTLYTEENGLANDFAGPMMEDKNGKIWISTDAGISIYDPAVYISPGAKAGTVTPAGVSITSKKSFTNYNTSDGLCNNSINSILQDKTGKVWIATREGVSWCDPSIANTKVDKELAAQNKVKKIFTDFLIKPGTPFTNVRRIMEDKKGIVWIGGADGLYRYNPTKGDSALTKLMSNFIGYISEDKAGNLWISCGLEKGMGLYKYDGKTFTEIIKKNGQNDVQVFESIEDKNGNIWFGVMNGVCRYDGKNFEEFRNYVQK